MSPAAPVRPAARSRRARGLALTAVAAALVLSASGVASPARAAAPDTFGFGPRSQALQQSDVAGAGDPIVAAQRNPALAAAPGVHVRLGYSYARLGLTIDGRETGLPEARGLELGAHAGGRLHELVDAGLALAAFVPDQSLARLSFVPATEPTFVRYGPSLGRASFDLVAALRVGPLALGGGVSVGLGVDGAGASFDLGASPGSAGSPGSEGGQRADGAVDLSLPYRLAPLVGAKLTLEPVALALAVRGSMGTDLSLPSDVDIALGGTPLDGTTRVVVRGVSGFDPLRVTLGARGRLVRAAALDLVLHAALEYAAYHEAPSPAAEVDLDVALGTVPSERVARYGAPRLRDTLTPRLGLELAFPGGSRDPFERARVALRAGWAFSPSPVPPQRGLTSYADAERHQVGLGVGVGLGAVFGAKLALSAAGQVHALVPRVEQKDDPSLTYARFTVDGLVGQGSAALEVGW